MSFWSQEVLCYGYTTQFDSHKATKISELRTMKYYEIMGYETPAQWCKGEALEAIQRKAAVKPEHERNLKILRKYCATA